MATVSLHIIAKDEIGQLRRIIKDYEKYFDAIDIAIDDNKVIDELAVEVSKKVNLYKYEWRNDFAHKHNFLAEKCRTDYYFRIDTDDEILNPASIAQVVQDAADKKLSIVYCYYDYSKDEWGNTNAAHHRETIILNTSNLFWNKPIHENIIPRTRVGFDFAIDDRVKINHLITHEHSIESAIRNIRYLAEEYNRDKDKTDPRTIAYLGRTFAGLGQYDRAVFFLEKHIELSGWDEDRFQSWCQLSDIYRFRKDFTKATACAFEALQERPDYPDAYIKLHDIYFDQGVWLKAIEWGKMGLSRPQPKNFTLVNPSQFTWMPTLSMAMCYFQIGEFETAKKLFDMAEKLVPTMEWVKKNKQLFSDAIEHRNFVKSFLEITRFLQIHEPGKIRDLVGIIPKVVEKSDVLLKIRNSFIPPKEYPNKSIVIYCGGTPEEFSPKSVGTGIGGSEEAAIQISKQFAKLGYEVKVYANCGENEGIYDGVVWEDYIKFNPRDRFNILIGWRSNIFAYNIQAKRKIVWLHDVPNNSELGGDLKCTYDKIVVLSQYHKSLLAKDIPEEKIYVSTNGIDPDNFLGTENVKREPHRIIYASSYNRGLEKILDNWKDIKQSIPDAQLHIYYGWDVYDKYVSMGLVKDGGFKDKMVKLMNQEGIYEHGRVGHGELAVEYAKASVFAYPCTYAGEINCIALTKAVACGCYPLTNDFAVLPERNKIGRVVKDNEFIHSLVTLLRQSVPAINNQGYIEDNSWAKVAKDWTKDIFVSDVEVVISDRFDFIYSNIEKGKKIIDIGSNKGHTFDGWDRSNITSVDIDDYDIPNFVRANAEELPFKDQEFDYAVLAEIVEHTKDPIKVLKEARRVAKNIVVTVPYEFEWKEVLQPFLRVGDKSQYAGFEEDIKKANPAKEITDDGYAHLFHETFYTPQLLEEHLTQAGYKDFKVVKIRFGEWAWLGAVCKQQL